MSVDYFLKIAEVPGESKDDTHKGEISLESWSWGETNQGAGTHGGGGGAGKVNMQDFNFVMKNNVASPKLVQACAAGTHFGSAILTCRKAGDKPLEYLIITFSDVFITSYNTGGSAHGDDFPMDQISLGYAKIEYSYFPQKADGTADNPVKAGYDLKLNKKV